MSSVRDPPPPRGTNNHDNVIVVGDDGSVTKIELKEAAAPGSTEKVTHRTATSAELFADADATDYMFMLLGGVGSLGTGAAMPVFCILFGQVLDKLNQGFDLQAAVNNICVLFIIGKYSSVPLLFLYERELRSLIIN
jgi:hypothetical protein